jgi:acetoin utilization protein AcuB
MNYLLSKITVKEVMTKKVISVLEHTPIEEAARIMVDNKIGGLPVLRDGELVGIITETDLFKIFLELMGAREFGVRVTALIREERGQLAKLASAIAGAGGNFIAFGQFTGETPNNRLISFKVTGMEENQVKDITMPMIEKLTDIRSC